MPYGVTVSTLDFGSDGVCSNQAGATIISIKMKHKVDIDEAKKVYNYIDKRLQEASIDIHSKRYKHNTYRNVLLYCMYNEWFSLSLQTLGNVADMERTTIYHSIEKVGLRIKMWNDYSIAYRYINILKRNYYESKEIQVL